MLSPVLPDQVTLTVNGVPIVVPSAATVAVAMVIAGQACRSQ